MLPSLEKIHPIARKVAGLPGRYIPYAAQKPLLSITLNEAFRVPFRHGELDFLEGRKVRISVQDLNIDWLLSVEADRFNPLDRNQDADVHISGNAMDFALLATRQADPDTLFFQRKIRIEGDTDLGLAVKNTMDSMDWDDLPVPIRKFLEVLAIVLEKLVLSGPGQGRD